MVSSKLNVNGENQKLKKKPIKIIYIYYEYEKNILTLKTDMFWKGQ